MSSPTHPQFQPLRGVDRSESGVTAPSWPQWIRRLFRSRPQAMHAVAEAETQSGQAGTRPAERSLLGPVRTVVDPKDIYLA